MRISESEMEIMKVIWSENAAVTTADILKKLNTDWKHTTILTFLKRLTDKGAIRTERVGKTNYYSALISENDYKNSKTQEFMTELHSGSIKNFLSALYGDKKPTAQEIKEIKEWFEEV